MKVDFISIAYNTITIDGSAKNAKKSIIEETSVVFLQSASTKNSGYKWQENISKVERVVAKNVLVYDYDDLVCLQWLSLQRKIVDFSALNISSDILGSLTAIFKGCIKSNLKVPKGSVISIPVIGGYNGLGIHEEAVLAARAIAL